jgi:hypothetical protein
VNGRTRLEARKRGLLREIEEALLDALAESRDVHRTLWNLHRAGFTLRLSLDCDEAPRAEPAPRARRSGNEPAGFRIDADDLRFLRSIGIDPTRKSRPRRSR